jgi:hypothetical protein
MKLLATSIMLFLCISVQSHPSKHNIKTSNNRTLLVQPRSGIKLAEDFVTPPDSAKPWVNMWWFDTITHSDITQHMEELKAKGVGGVILIDLGKMPGAPYMSDKWRELYRFALGEADRVGLKMGVNICEMWPSGGTWITPENGSMMVVSSETFIDGPQIYSDKLVEPKGKGAQYHPVSVQAFPLSDHTSNTWPVIRVSGDSSDAPGLQDGNYMTVWRSGENGNQWVLVDYGSPHLVDWAWIDVEGEVSLEASDDSITFRPVTVLNSPRYNTYYGAIPSTRSRWFRLTVPNKKVVHDISLGTRTEVDRFARLASKRAITNPLGITATRQADQVNLVRQDLVALPIDQPLKISDMIDLTEKVSDEGTLNWKVPPGKWKVVQIGYTTTGISVGRGLLPDYLSMPATEQNYEKGMKPLVYDAGALVGKTLNYYIEDNVETRGIYSWTPELLKEFIKRRGYNPVPYLSVMAGEIVENITITDRFLSDIRRTIADCVADGHYGRWAELAHADGMKVRAEAGGQHHPRLLCNDGLMNQGRMDVPVAEFWVSNLWKENQWVPADHHTIAIPGWEESAQNVNAKQAASAGHLYGKPLVGSEAFTSAGSWASWCAAPGDLLLHANIAFCEGINSMSIHGSATSGPEDGKPGKVFGAGTHFNHNITWWNQSAGPFLRYLSRCQYMLQQGVFVADVLYYNGDEAPSFVPPKNIDPSRGFGYDYDVCNTEILLTRLSVKDGRVVLPDGMSYRILVLPDRPVIPLSVAVKIEELVASGATVIGPKPRRTPGLANYPESEQKLSQIADRVWGTETSSSIHKYGNGYVIIGSTIREVLANAGLIPDFAYES